MSNDENKVDQIEDQNEKEPGITSQEENIPEVDDFESFEELSAAVEMSTSSEIGISPEESEDETPAIALREESIPEVDDFESFEESSAAGEKPTSSEIVISAEESGEEEPCISLKEKSIPEVDDFDSFEESSAAIEMPTSSEIVISAEEFGDEEPSITLKEESIEEEEDFDSLEEPSAAAGLPNGLEIVISPEESEEEVITAQRDELKPAIEALLFVAEDPLPFKQICRLLGDVPEEDVEAALKELVKDYDIRECGLEIREIAGGWRISTRPQYHEFIRKYLKSRPSARLSLPALETLAVIAYKQPITAPEILEIRGVTSSSAIKTLLEKRLIVTKGRKETVGRPMLYGTSKEFLIHFGLKDLSELPSIEDFEDLAH